VRYHIQNGIEMVAMMQEYYQFTENKAFLTDTLIPFAEKIYQFYLNHYSVSNGKLQISPAQVLETYWLAVNPMPEIAGLHWTISNFKQLETSLLGESFLQTLTQIDQLKPDLPIAGGRLLPALSFSDKHNIEKGEMYAVYPYRIYSLINQNTPIGVTTFKNGTKRTDVENFYQYGMKADTSKRGTNGRVDFCWIQDAIFASNLGLKTEAKLLLLERWTNPDARFPVFWKFDWIPDQDHVANGMTTLQNMLLQADNGKILIVPSLPNEWNARFKLHAPMNTIVEAEYDKGELITLNVSPQSRMADVYILKNNELVKAEPKNVVSSIEINENKGLRIYPNPVSDYLSIELPQQLSEKTQLSVFNLMGQKMKITQISRFGNTIQLPVDELNVGVYYLQIVSKTYSESLNFIVK